MQQEWYALEVQTHQSHKGKIEIAPIDNLHFKAENQEQSKPKMTINKQSSQTEGMKMKSMTEKLTARKSCLGRNRIGTQTRKRKTRDEENDIITDKTQTKSFVGNYGRNYILIHLKMSMKQNNFWIHKCSFKDGL